METCYICGANLVPTDLVPCFAEGDTQRLHVGYECCFKRIGNTSSAGFTNPKGGPRLFRFHADAQKYDASKAQGNVYARKPKGRKLRFIIGGLTFAQAQEFVRKVEGNVYEWHGETGEPKIFEGSTKLSEVR
jgi:hypothetical protein